MAMPRVAEIHKENTMRITENSLRRIVREEIIREAVKGGKMTLREGRRLMEQDGPPDARPAMKKNAEELSTLDGLTKGSDSQIHISDSEMISKGLFDKGSENMKRFQQDVVGSAKRAAENMYDKAFFMDDDKVLAAGKEGYQKYAFKSTTDQEWDCKNGSITDLQVFAIPTEKGIVTKAYAVLNRDGRKTNIQFGGLPKKDL